MINWAQLIGHKLFIILYLRRKISDVGLEK